MRGKICFWLIISNGLFLGLAMYLMAVPEAKARELTYCDKTPSFFPQKGYTPPCHTDWKCKQLNSRNHG